MAIQIDNVGPNIFPTVDFLDAQPEGAGIGLIFGTKIEGQSARLLVRLSRKQWEALKTIAEGVK
jgi:hypothetical protein